MKKDKEPQLTFPREWEFRIIIVEALRPAAETGIAEVLMGKAIAVLPGEKSRSGAYTTIVIKLEIQSRKELEELTKKLSNVSGVKFLL